MSQVTYSTTGMETTANAIKTAKTNLDAFTNLPEMDELTMIEYNLAASKYSTMVSLSSGLVKNLSDTEKQVANKM
ncbi:MAG: hypothetical protein LBV80_05970 [Deltaproteobacteria bacterium]|jgi:roadblock/LC7 domain-containing protein|nr:hypothetical protein [Deltaproteobacteria bacterium]